MSKYEVSSCINEWIFSFSSLIVDADNKKEAIMEYLQRLKEEIYEQGSSNIEMVLEKADDCVWEVQDE